MRCCTYGKGCNRYPTNFGTKKEWDYGYKQSGSNCEIPGYRNCVHFDFCNRVRRGGPAFVELADAGGIRVSPNHVLAGGGTIRPVLDFIWWSTRMDESTHGPRPIYASQLGEDDTGGTGEISNGHESALRDGISCDRPEYCESSILKRQPRLRLSIGNSAAALSAIFIP